MCRGFRTTCVLFALRDSTRFLISVENFLRFTAVTLTVCLYDEPLGRWSMDGKADRLQHTVCLRKSDRCTSESAYRREPLPISRSRAYWNLSTVDHLWPEPGLHIATLSLASLACVATKVIEQPRHTKGPKNQITELADCRGS